MVFAPPPDWNPSAAPVLLLIAESEARPCSSLAFRLTRRLGSSSTGVCRPSVPFRSRGLSPSAVCSARGLPRSFTRSPVMGFKRFRWLISRLPETFAAPPLTVLPFEVCLSTRRYSIAAALPFLRFPLIFWPVWTRLPGSSSFPWGPPAVVGFGADSGSSTCCPGFPGPRLPAGQVDGHVAVVTVSEVGLGSSLPLSLVSSRAASRKSLCSVSVTPALWSGQGCWSATSAGHHVGLAPPVPEGSGSTCRRIQKTLHMLRSLPLSSRSLLAATFVAPSQGSRSGFGGFVPASSAGPDHRSVPVAR